MPAAVPEPRCRVMSPAVSVIMAVHNGEAHIREAADSILSQTLSNLELIVVDDASTDATAEVLARYDDPRIIRLRNERRLGPGGARNCALRMARAPLIAIQDADDISLPHRLETQAEIFAKNPALGAAGAYAAVIGRAGRDGGTMSYPPTRDLEIKWALLFWNPFIHTAVMVRRSVLEETGGYAERGELAWLAEDYELLSRINRKHRTANVGEVLVKYRINPFGASTRLGELQRLSEEVSGRNVSWLLGDSGLDGETLQAVRRFWFDGKSLSPAEARRALTGNKRLHRAFFSRYVKGGPVRVSRARFYLGCARRALGQARRNSQLQPSCRADMVFSTIRLALKAMV